VAQENRAADSLSSWTRARVLAGTLPRCQSTMKSHFAPPFTADEIQGAVAPLKARIAELESRLNITKP